MKEGSVTITTFYVLYAVYKSLTNSVAFLVSKNDSSLTVPEAMQNIIVLLNSGTPGILMLESISAAPCVIIPFSVILESVDAVLLTIHSIETPM